MRAKRAILLVLAVLVLGGCANAWSPSSRAPNTLPAELTARSGADGGVTPPFGSTAQPAAYEERIGYRVGAGDQLQIRVAGQEELTGEYRVNSAGEISMPLLKTVEVAGLTAPEIERRIEARLKQGFLRNPNVSIEVGEQRPFFILGEVQSPGQYPYVGGMTVQNAVAVGGGYTPRANQGKVLITRRTAEGTHTGRVPITTPIYPGDIVYVRERWF